MFVIERKIDEGGGGGGFLLFRWGGKKLKKDRFIEEKGEIGEGNKFQLKGIMHMKRG